MKCLKGVEGIVIAPKERFYDKVSRLIIAFIALTAIIALLK